MHLDVIGISHKTAPIEVREKFCLSAIEQELLLSQLKLRNEVLGAFVVSTCNRIEIYVDMVRSNLDAEFVLQTLFQVKKQKWHSDFKNYFYRQSKDNAIEHLFKVISSLDSLILGEKQILGQVKEAFAKAQESNMLSRALNLLCRVAVRMGKLAHEETEIGYGGTSVSWAAVNFSEKYLGSLSGKKVLLIGSGQMGELAAKQLTTRSLDTLYIMNRTRDKSMALAEKFQAEAVSFLELTRVLQDVNLCICAVNAPHYVVDREVMEHVMRHRTSELLLMDISMPRNIDPQVAQYDQLALFAIDDLGATLEQNYQRRKTAIKDVYSIIDRKISEFYTKLEKMKEFGSNQVAASSQSEVLKETV